jgi:excisionase family DNA binding protein
LKTIVEEIRASKSALTVPKLATLLSLGKRTVYDHIDSGSLPAYKIGTSLRLDPATTADWLERRFIAA